MFVLSAMWDPIEVSIEYFAATVPAGPPPMMAMRLMAISLSTFRSMTLVIWFWYHLLLLRVRVHKVMKHS